MSATRYLSLLSLLPIKMRLLILLRAYLLISLRLLKPKPPQNLFTKLDNKIPGYGKYFPPRFVDLEKLFRMISFQMFSFVNVGATALGS